MRNPKHSNNKCACIYIDVLTCAHLCVCVRARGKHVLVNLSMRTQPDVLMIELLSNVQVVSTV